MIINYVINLNNNMIDIKYKSNINNIYIINYIKINKYKRQ